MKTRHVTTISALAVAGLVLTACGDAESSGDAASAPSGEPSAAPSEWPNQAEEVTTAQSRLVATYDGGLLVLDGQSLEVLETIELDGFLRVNPAGDGRHVIVSTDQAFQVLDTGAWSVPHGDHAHHYVGEPALTDIAFDTDHPGHVVRHAGSTVLFSDGTGQVEIFPSGDLADGQPETEIIMADQPHHGVAVRLADDELLITLGDEETRTGAKVLDADGTEIARSEECPGVHGEAMAAGETVVVGCEDGVLVYSDGAFTKIASPDPYGRIGNQAGSEESTVVLGDYKVDPDTELERPERVSLIDTATNTLQLVDLGVSYTFRSLARGPAGEALVLGTDGAIHVIDPATGQVATTIPVIGAWTEPEDWQLPRPTLVVDGGTAYVTDPAAGEIHAVDLAAGSVVTSASLPETPNELAAANG
ncbi:zinc metallochaperone AztD [Jiangella gansuensis]|uniref:zinc metallochaperone AztD n=1 Tax=Jiangella gansuensis TaxID=281473 RepID=UPI00047D19E7|nr:zinc metallochaperone AztD [Jiangella gansuensis]